MACYRLVYDYESKRLSSFKKVSFSSGGRVARVCTCFVLSVDVRSFLPWFVYVMSL